MKRCTRCALRYPFTDDQFCAQCGSPLITVGFFENNQTAIISIVVVGSFILLIAIGVNLERKGQPRPSSPTSTGTLTPAHRAEAQAMKDKACDTVNRLRAAGGFTKIEAGYSGVTHAYVDRGFYEIDIDSKETTLKWVAVCYLDIDKKNQLGIVVVHDGRSGKRIGTFDFASGLDME